MSILVLIFAVVLLVSLIAVGITMALAGRSTGHRSQEDNGGSGGWLIVPFVLIALLMGFGAFGLYAFRAQETQVAAERAQFARAEEEDQRRRLERANTLPRLTTELPPPDAAASPGAAVETNQNPSESPASAAADRSVETADDQATEPGSNPELAKDTASPDSGTEPAEGAEVVDTDEDGDTGEIEKALAATRVPKNLELPAWTQTKSELDGRTTLLTVASRPRLTLEEAQADVQERTQALLEERWREMYGQQGEWTIPEQIYPDRRHVRREHDQIYLADLGEGRTVPMHILHWQVELTRELDDRAYQSWKKQNVGRQVWRLGSATGFVTLCFALLAGYFQITARTQGRHSRLLLLAVIALAGAAAIGTMSLVRMNGIL